jgi:hypothetical protein
MIPCHVYVTEYWIAMAKVAPKSRAMSLLSLAKLPLVMKLRIGNVNFLLTSAIASATQIHGFRNGGDRYINVDIHHPQADINCKVRAEILIIESLCELDLASGSDCTDTCAFFKSLASLKRVGHLSFHEKGTEDLVHASRHRLCIIMVISYLGKES